jgi:hypothetical protein
MLYRNKFIAFVFFFLLSALIASPTNLSGKWSGVIEIDDSGNKIETPVDLYLDHKDGALSGKIGRANDPERVEIRNGAVQGDNVTFEASSEETSSSMKFFLTVQGEQMSGEMKGAVAGNDIVAKVSFSRAK